MEHGVVLHAVCVICIPKGFAFPGLVKKIRLSPDHPARLQSRFATMSLIIF